MRCLLRRGPLRCTALLAAAVLLSSVSAAASPRERESPTLPKTQAFPRTYHLWGTDAHLDSLARYDMVVGYAYWDIRALRRRNPSGVFLLNPGLATRNRSDYRGLAITYGAVRDWRGGTDRLRGGPKLGRIRAFDARWDELHNDDGSLALVNERWRHSGWNLADPRNRGTPALVAKVLAHASKRNGVYSKGWDGIHSDNWIYRIGVDWFYGSRLDTDRDGRVDDYDALRRNWARGLTRAGVLLRSYLPGKIVGGNGNWNVGRAAGVDFRQYLARPDDHLRSGNYTLLEELQMYTARADEIVATAREWLSFRDPRGQTRYFAMLERLGSSADYRSMRWGLSLATVAGAHYGAYVSSHDDRLWLDEYDGGEGIRRRNWLGAPVSEPYKLEGGVWRRDFENGTVLNNSTSSAQTIRLERAFGRLRGTQDQSVNNGTTTADVTLQPLDGIFLRRLGLRR